MNNNVLSIRFPDGERFVESEPLHQWDYGIKVVIENVDLPSVYEVHFSNLRFDGTSKTVVGSPEGFVIPQEYLESGRDIQAYIYTHATENDGETYYHISIPVIKRARPTDEEPTPTEQSAMEALIARTTQVVSDAEDAINNIPNVVNNAIANSVDKTLTISDKPADAKAVGDELDNLKSNLSKIFSDKAKNALIDVFKHLYWKDDSGENQLNILKNALFEGAYPKIVATFNSGENVIYTDDPINSLKQYLMVKYYETKESQGEIVTDYTISGILVDGQSTLSIQYNGIGTSITIDTVDYYNIHTWVMGDNVITLSAGGETGLNDEVKYPSRIAYYTNATRKTNVTIRGKAPFYMWNQTAVPTEHYPIPIPSGANHVKITTLPNTQNVYFHTIQYLPESNKYGNSIPSNRIEWTAVDANGVIEKDIVNTGNLFAIVNLRYNSSNAQYPEGAPSQIIIEFSEV